jgi:hypothetical protein
LVQSRGFGGTNIYQTIINNESHKYNMYVVLRGI